MFPLYDLFERSQIARVKQNNNYGHMEPYQQSFKEVYLQTVLDSFLP